MGKKNIRWFTSMGKKDSIGSPQGIQKRIDAMGNQAPSMADLSIPINISAKRIAQSVKTNKQLKISKKELAQSARNIFSSINKGKQLIANARQSVKIPVKNMKTSMAIEQPKVGPIRKLWNTVPVPVRNALSIGTKVGGGALNVLAAYDTTMNVIDANERVGKHGNKRFNKLKRKGRAKHVSKIIQSSLNQLRDR